LLEFEAHLDELRDSDVQISSSILANLSGLSSEESELFRKTWSVTDLERRHQIVNQMVDITEKSDYQLDFDEAFMVIMKDDDRQVRLGAVYGLRDCEDLTLIRHLIELLDKGYDEQTRAAAASSLYRFTTLDELGKLSNSYSEKVESALMGIIKSNGENAEVRRHAIEAIAPLSQPHVKDIIRDAYESDDPKLRRSAICAMGRNCDPVWLPFLLKEMRNEDPENRFEAAVASGELCAPEAVPSLLKLTRDSDIQVELAAITSLGHIGSVDAKEVLRGHLLSTDERVRQAAEIALEELGFNEDPLGFDDIDD